MLDLNKPLCYNGKPFRVIDTKIVRTTDQYTAAGAAFNGLENEYLLVFNPKTGETPDRGMKVTNAITRYIFTPTGELGGKPGDWVKGQGSDPEHIWFEKIISSTSSPRREVYTCTEEYI